jgi:hypothetical protein
MSENHVATLKRCRSRAPAARKARIQEFVGIWLVVPHGDRHDRAQSRRVIDEDESVDPRDHDVDREFVLNDDTRENVAKPVGRRHGL